VLISWSLLGPVLTWWRWRSEIEAVPSMSAARLPRASAVEV